MSLAAFLGGGERQEGQGLLGRANAVASENREHDRKMTQIAFEEGLQSQADAPIPFNIIANNPVDPKNPLIFNYHVNPLYLTNEMQRKIEAENLMGEWSSQPDSWKQAQWNNPETRSQLEGIINIIKNQSYQTKYSDDGKVGSHVGINSLKTYKDPWSRGMIWNAADNEKLAFNNAPVTPDSWKRNIGIETTPTPNGTIKTSSRYDETTSRILAKGASNFTDLAPIYAQGGQATNIEIGRLVNTLSEEDDYIFKNDFGAIVAGVTNILNPTGTRHIGGSHYTSGYDADEENRILRLITEQQNAVDNGIVTALEMAKLGLGWVDSNNKHHPPLAVVGSALDIVTGINNFVESIKGASTFLSNQTALIDANFVTGEKTEAGNKFESREDFLDKRYDGLSIRTYLENGLNPKDKQLSKMYRYKALQIHLTFQLAIAMQGFQGGKAVSDADFDRAWMLLTGNTGKSIFARMSGPGAVKEGLRTVTQQFARMAVYNKAYQNAKDGTRKQTAKLVLEIFDKKAEQENVELGQYAMNTIYRAKQKGIMWDGFASLEEDFKEYETDKESYADPSWIDEEI